MASKKHCAPEGAREISAKAMNNASFAPAGAMMTIPYHPGSYPRLISCNLSGCCPLHYSALPGGTTNCGVGTNAFGLFMGVCGIRIVSPGFRLFKSTLGLTAWNAFIEMP
jgi:hypothetical protein